MEKTCTISHSQSPVFSNNFEELQVSSGAEHRTFSMRELVDTFPEAKRVIKEMVKEDECVLKQHTELKNKINNELFKRAPMADMEILAILAFSMIRDDFVEHKNRNKIFKEGEYIAD